MRSVIDTEPSIKRQMLDFDYYEEYLTNIKQNIIMPVLRKANFHSVDICRFMKNQSCKRRSRRKAKSNFIIIIGVFLFFFQAVKLFMTFYEEKCSAYYRTLLTPKNII